MNLQPLRIEAGWLVNYNQLYEVDPTDGNERYFEGSSLLMLQNNLRLKLIDVAWRPELDLAGEYIVTVVDFVENFNSKSNTLDINPLWKSPHLTFATQSRAALVEQLERLMITLPVYEDPRIVKNRGILDEPAEAYRLDLLTNGLSKDLIEKILENDSVMLQNHLLDHKAITRDILLLFAENGITKKVRNKAKQKLQSKKFK